MTRWFAKQLKHKSIHPSRFGRKDEGDNPTPKETPADTTPDTATTAPPAQPAAAAPPPPDPNEPNTPAPGTPPPLDTTTTPPPRQPAQTTQAAQTPQQVHYPEFVTRELIPQAKSGDDPMQQAVLADWLMEQGGVNEIRGQIMQLHRQMMQLPEGQREGSAYRHQIRELLHGREDNELVEYLAPWGHLLRMNIEGVPGVGVTSNTDGFLTVMTSPDRFQQVLSRHGDEALRWVKRVRFSRPVGNEPMVRDILDGPWVGHVSELDFSQTEIGSHSLEPLFGNDSAGSIRMLDLSDCPVGAIAIESLRTFGIMTNLRDLRLRHSEYVGLNTLGWLNSSAFHRLQRLDLSDNGLNKNAVAQIILRSPHLDNLRHLTIQGAPPEPISRHYRTRLRQRGIEVIDRTPNTGIQ